MLALRTLLLAAVSLSFAALVSAQASNDDPTGKKLYVTYPSCGSYQCKVYWKAGERVNINWLNPPSGDVEIHLEPETDSSLPTYVIVDRISGTHAASKCDHAGQSTPCGRYRFTVPSNWKAGEYTVDVHSLDHKKYHGYTDTVVIGGKSKRRMSAEDFEQDVQDGVDQVEDEVDEA